MEKRRKVLAAGAVAAALLVGGAGIALATDGGDDDGVPTGQAFDRASEAALAEAGAGTVTDVDRDDGRYEVEVTRPDGGQVDVLLDGDFTVLAADRDGDLDDRDDRDDDVPVDQAPAGGGSAGTPASTAPASDPDLDDRVLTPEERQRAAAAAVAEVGSGTATDVDASETGSGYDVEVTRPDGTEVDVLLAADLTVRSATADLDD